MIQLETPFTEEKIRQLKVGDMVELTGVVFTGRDAVHKWLHEGNDPPYSFRDGIIYHCGPVMMRRKVKEGKKSPKKWVEKWVATAAGPTTSIREEPYQADIIARLGVRAVIGKGGMGEKTRQACATHGCVYLHAVGGAAQVLAECIQEVEDVFGIEKFGSPEAIWKLRVAAFPVVVTIDAHGNSLHKEIEAESGEKLTGLFKR